MGGPAADREDRHNTCSFKVKLEAAGHEGACCAARPSTRRSSSPSSDSLPTRNRQSPADVSGGPTPTGEPQMMSHPRTTRAVLPVDAAVPGGRRSSRGPDAPAWSSSGRWWSESTVRSSTGCTRTPSPSSSRRPGRPQSRSTRAKTLLCFFLGPKIHPGLFFLGPRAGAFPRVARVRSAAVRSSARPQRQCPRGGC